MTLSECLLWELSRYHEKLERVRALEAKNTGKKLDYPELCIYMVDPETVCLLYNDFNKTKLFTGPIDGAIPIITGLLQIMSYPGVD